MAMLRIPVHCIYLYMCIHRSFFHMCQKFLSHANMCAVLEFYATLSGCRQSLQHSLLFVASTLEDVGDLSRSDNIGLGCFRPERSATSIQQSCRQLQPCLLLHFPCPQPPQRHPTHPKAAMCSLLQPQPISPSNLH